jgi:hypothetical protein
VQEVRKRRAGLRSAKLEPGLGYWLARQAWLWRRGGLQPERAALLRQAGAELGAGSGAEWRDGAHLAAFYLTSCRIAKVQSPLHVMRGRFSRRHHRDRVAGGSEGGKGGIGLQKRIGMVRHHVLCAVAHGMV